MSKKLLIVIYFLLLLPALANAKLEYTGFDGGMMVHTGFVTGKNIDIYNDNNQLMLSTTPKGAPTGIGGMAKVHFGKHLRIGMEGYVTNLKYSIKGTHSSLGWGGVMADCIWKPGRFWPFVGGTIGGGGFKNMVLTQDYTNDYITEQNVLYRHYSMMLITPYVGVEFALTEKIHLALKLDYIIPVVGRQNDFATGPRIYFGFMFHRGKPQQNISK
ncbi:MAG: hypothetical protein Q4D14_01490 [Bacteroidales bacterium]|nr:hypothetical protein [Bacteroidales bacterium]